MALKTSFCFRSIFKRHTIGIGRQRTRTSMIKLHIPFQRKKLISSMHTPGPNLSQFFDTGLQPAMATTVHAIQ